MTKYLITTIKLKCLFEDSGQNCPKFWPRGLYSIRSTYFKRKDINGLSLLIIDITVGAGYIYFTPPFNSYRKITERADTKPGFLALQRSIPYRHSDKNRVIKNAKNYKY